MILADSSAWIPYLRAADHPLRWTMRRLIEREADVAVTEPVVMELLAGARGEREVRQIRVRLLSLPLLRLEGLADYERAALLYRTCRRAGETVRGLVDCVIAAVALREGAEILHDNADFDAIARHSELRIHAAGPGRA